MVLCKYMAIGISHRGNSLAVVCGNSILNALEKFVTIYNHDPLYIFSKTEYEKGKMNVKTAIRLHNSLHRRMRRYK